MLEMTGTPVSYARQKGGNKTSEPRPEAKATAPDQESRAVSFVTTEHFALQGARTAAIAESTGRASMFLSSVSGGLIALGLVATAAGQGAAFYTLGLVVLPLLAFIGLVTFERTLQSGVEDHGYARRIARLREYYFDHAPELSAYMVRAPAPEPFLAQGVLGGRWQMQGWRTIAGMVAVITAGLTASAAGLLVALVLHSLTAALAAGAIVFSAILVTLMKYQSGAWKRADTATLDPINSAERA
jgi:hypothetical protein